MHPLAPINLDTQIPKKGDQRQMEPWQRIGTYAAGLALDNAQIKGKADILARTDMIVAAGGGERDMAVDGTILTGIDKAADPEAFLNERLMSDLRPTLFLAQLSNLLAGNISIVHGVIGSSRTFMGEESAGVDAVRIALARILAGDSDIALVGGSQHCEREDMLLLYEFERANLRDKFAPVWQRGPRGGFVLGSLGAFLVIEARSHAEARGAKPLARLTTVLSERAKPHGRRAPGDARTDVGLDCPEVAPRPMRHYLRGVGRRTGDRRGAGISRGPSGRPGAGHGDADGHGVEPTFPMNVALAALALSHGAVVSARRRYRRRTSAGRESSRSSS